MSDMLRRLEEAAREAQSIIQRLQIQRRNQKAISSIHGHLKLSEGERRDRRYHGCTMGARPDQHDYDGIDHGKEWLDA
nr:unnamed protein product [Callosobruchus chinensis]